MAVVARDHVGAAVTVDVVRFHVGTAAGRVGEPERTQMKRPDRVLGDIGRLLEPAVLRQQVGAAVAVHVACTVAVRIAKILLVVLGRLRRDGAKPGLRERLFPVDLGEPQLAA